MQVDELIPFLILLQYLLFQILAPVKIILSDVIVVESEDLQLVLGFER